MKKVLALSVFLILVPISANAQFGFGSITEAIMLGKILAQDIIVAGATSTTAGNTGSIAGSNSKILQLAQYAASAVPGLASRYGWQTVLMRLPYLWNDYYGMGSPFVSAEQTGYNASGNYEASVSPIVPLTAQDWSSMSPDEQTRVGELYADAEIFDSTSAQALGTIGDVESESRIAAPAIDSLQADSFSFAPTELSATAIGQRQNAGEVMSVQEGEQTNKLLVAILMVQLARLKAERASLVKEIYSNTTTGSEALTGTIEDINGESQAAMTFQYP